MSRSVRLLAATSLVLVALVSPQSGHANASVTFSPGAFLYPGGLNLTSPWSETPVKTGDFNGDGRTDFMRPGATKAFLFFSDGADGFTTVEYAYPNGWDFGFDQGLWQTVTGDFDLDGRTDFMQVGQTSVKVFRSQVTGMPAAGALPAASYIATSWTYPYGWTFTPPWSLTPVTVGDFNGDRRIDFMRAGPTYAHLFLNDGAGGFAAPYYYFPEGSDFGFDQAIWHTVADDIDGDGRTDFMQVGPSSVSVFYSHIDGLSEGLMPGTAFEMKPWTYPYGWTFTPPWSMTPVLTGDFNGDGFVDFLRPGATYTHMFFNDGAGGFRAPYYYYPGGWDFGFDQTTWRTAAGDFNGDGRVDFIGVGPTSAKLLTSQLDGLPPEGLMPASGFGATNIDYPSGWDFGSDPALYKLNVLDIDGNGRSDLLRVGQTAAYWLRFFAQGSTFLTVSPSTASLNGTVMLDATLTARKGKPVAGKAVTFQVTGSDVGTATTDPNGLATLGNVSLAGIAAGVHSQGIGARFEGDIDHAPVAATAPLEIVKWTQTIGVESIAPQRYGNLPFEVVPMPGASSQPLSITGAGACRVSGTTVTIVAAGDCVLSVAQAGDEVYQDASMQLTVPVAPASLRVSVLAASKAYAEPNPAFAPSYDGFVPGEGAGALQGTLTFSTAATAQSPAGTYAVTPGGVSSSNYAITFVDGTLDVNPAALTVKANDVSKIYGEATPAFSVSYAGFVLGEDSSALTGTLTFSTAATDGSPAGVYPVTPGGLTSGNYAITFVDGTLTVTEAAAPADDLDGRIYGKGLISAGSQQHLFMFRVSRLRNQDYGRLEYVSVGGRPLLDVLRDANGFDGDDERGYGRDHRGRVNRFEATSFTQMRFIDDPAFVPGKNKRAPAVDSVIISGTGTWNGKAGYTFDASAADRGDGRGTSDTFALVVRDSRGATVAAVNGVILGTVESTRLKAKTSR